MKRILTLAGSIALLACLTTPAAAQFYFSAHGGMNILQSTEFEDPDFAAAGLKLEGSFDTDYALGATAGFDFPFGLRAEGEVTWRRNSFDEIEATAAGVAVNLTADGDVDGVAVMGNAWYDISLPGPVTPYVGGGIGLVHVSLDKLTTTVPGVGTFTLTDGESDTAFAFQLGAGAAIKVAPKIHLTVDYRYLNATGLDFDGTEADYRSHTALVGIRFTL